MNFYNEKFQLLFRGQKKDYPINDKIKKSNLYPSILTTKKKEIPSIERRTEITNNFERTIIYLTDYHTLKRNVKDQLIKQILDKKCVICSLESDDEFTHKKVVFNSKINL